MLTSDEHGYRTWVSSYGRSLSGSDGGDLAVVDARYDEVQELTFQAERHGALGMQELDGLYLDSCGQPHADGLRAERIDRLQPTMVGVGVGVVEHVHRVAGGRLPGKNLDEAFALDVDNFLVASNPADRVVQEPQEVAMASEPPGALDVSGEIGGATVADFAQDYGRLRCVRDGRIGQLWRILHEAGDDGENGFRYGLERHPVLRAGNPVGVREACKNRVLALDATVVGVAGGTHDIACLADAEEIGQAEVPSLLQVLVVEAGFKAGHD
jgi:hypothetical protein